MKIFIQIRGYLKNNPGPATRKPVRSRRAAGAGRVPYLPPWQLAEGPISSGDAPTAAPSPRRPESGAGQLHARPCHRPVRPPSSPAVARSIHRITAAQGEQGRTSRWSDHCLKCAESPIFFRVSKKFGPRTRRTGGESLSSPSARWQRMSPDRPANFTRQVL